jgi:hypothetical protein
MMWPSQRIGDLMVALKRLNPRQWWGSPEQTARCYFQLLDQGEDFAARMELAEEMARAGARDPSEDELEAIILEAAQEREEKARQ